MFIPLKKGTTGWQVSTQADVAYVYDVSVQTVQIWLQRGMPGKSGAYKLRPISHWLKSQNLGPIKTESPDPSDTLLAADVDSPGLERYRLAKAAIAELDLEERRGGLMALGKVRTALGRWSAIIRHLGERLAKRYGNEAAESLNDALAECHRVIGYEFCSRPADGTADPDANLVSPASSGTDPEDDESVGGG